MHADNIALRVNQWSITKTGGYTLVISVFEGFLKLPGTLRAKKFIVNDNVFFADCVCCERIETEPHHGVRLFVRPSVCTRDSSKAVQSRAMLIVGFI